MKKSSYRMLLFIVPLLVLAAAAGLTGCKAGSGDDGGDNGTTPTEPRDLFIAAGQYSGDYFPTSGWRQCSPEQVGMDSSRLKDVYDYVASDEYLTHSVIIIRKGYVVAEAYFGDWNQSLIHDGLSIANSFTAALIGIALKQGFFTDLDEEVFNYFPQWQTPETPAAKKRITIRHLLTMTSGLRWHEDYSNPYSDDNRMTHSGDYVQYVLDREIDNEPGSLWHYSGGDAMLLSGVLQEATGKNAYEFGKENLFDAIGIPDIYWAGDSVGHTTGSGAIGATLRDYAKFGYFILKNGNWDGQQILPETWVADSSQPGNEYIDFYGYMWWLAPHLREIRDSNVPPDTIISWGIGLQQIFVIPSKDLVVVRLANDLFFLEWLEVDFLAPIIDSIQ